MTRNTDTAVTSISQRPQLQYHMLCEVYSATGGTGYACTGNRYIYSSNTYTPVGKLASIEKIQEGSDIFPRAVRLRFAAVNSAMIADVLGESLFSKPVRLYRCFLTDSYTVAGTPQLAFLGYINQVDMKLKDEQMGNYFEIECESRLRQPAKAIYFNKQTLHAQYSGDTFFDYSPQIPLVTANWGNQPTGTTYDGPSVELDPSYYQQDPY